MKIISTAGSTWSAAHLARLAAGALDTWIQIQIQKKIQIRILIQTCTNMNALVREMTTAFSHCCSYEGNALIPKCFKNDISTSPPRRIPRERWPSREPSWQHCGCPVGSAPWKSILESDAKSLKVMQNRWKWCKILESDAKSLKVMQNCWKWCEISKLERWILTPMVTIDTHSITCHSGKGTFVPHSHTIAK